MKILKTVGKLGCVAGIALISYFVGYQNAKQKVKKQYMEDMMDISDYDEMPEDSETDSSEDKESEE